MASSAAFAATAVSFKKVIPKLRGAIGNRVSKIATSASQKAASKGKTTIAAIGNEVAENGKKIANEGSNLLKRTLNKTLGDAKGQNVSDALGKVGIKNEMDVVDTAAALGIATFTSREAGDIVDEEHKERSLKDAVRDIAKIAGSMGGEVTEFAEII